MLLATEKKTLILSDITKTMTSIIKQKTDIELRGAIFFFNFIATSNEYVAGIGLVWCIHKASTESAEHTT